MRAFIQCDKIYNLPYNPNVFNAYDGLRDMGFECIFFQTHEDLLKLNHEKDEIIVGGIWMIRRRLEDFGIHCPEINYPESLKKYLGRNIWTSTINRVRDNPNSWPIFVKSIEGKKLTGKVISSIHDLVGCGYCDEDYPVLCSNPLNIVAEWRVFVRYGQVMDVRPYKGDWSKHYDPEIIKSAIQDYTDAPNAYGIDFGVTEEGKTVLIEVNDGYSLGCYGMFALKYAKFLITRWAELTDILDEYWYI